MRIARPQLKCFCSRWLKRLAILLALLVLGYGLLPKPELLPPDLEYSRTVLDRDGQVLFLTTNSDGKLRLPTTVAQLATELLEATLEMEDRRFYDHPGVDPRSIARAAWGLMSQQKLGGGST
ncbi:MAG: transglycosylase domain-containing protein, partial [Verrucomicrobiales bacterium]